MNYLLNHHHRQSFHQAQPSLLNEDTYFPRMDPSLHCPNFLDRQIFITFSILRIFSRFFFVPSRVHLYLKDGANMFDI